MADKFNAEEWVACEDPSRMLRAIADTAAERSLRLFACTYCRRIWEQYPLDWAEREFAKLGPGEIRYVGPTDWIAPRPRVAVDVADAFCRGEASADELRLAHESACKFADYMRGQWEWAEYRRGDAGHHAEGDVGAVTAQTAAARDASDPDIRNSVVRCADDAASAIAYRELEARRGEAVRVEKNFQSQLIRELCT